MFISKIVLNPYIPATQRLLSNRHFLHGAVEACFHEKEQNVLWRLYTDKRDPEIYIISSKKPDVKHIVQQYGREDESCVIIKDYSGVIESVEDEILYKLQVEVNPVKRDNRTRRLIPLVHSHHIEEWLERQAANNGFSVQGSVLQRPKPTSRVSKPGHSIPIESTQLDCVVKVENAESFAKFLVQGIGKSKAYGFGMPLVGKI